MQGGPIARLLVLPSLTAAILAVGCSGGTPPDTAGVARTSTPAPDRTPSIVAGFASATFTAQYTLRIDWALGPVEGTVTWYQQPGVARADFAGEAFGGSVELTFITEQAYALDGFRYLCDRTAEFCAEFGLDRFHLTQNTQEPLPREAQLFLAFGPRLDVGIRGLEFVEPTGAREIAGEESWCFDYSEIDPSYPGQPVMCASHEGIALAVTETADSYSLQMEASAFERQVDESVFDVPYPLTD